MIVEKTEWNIEIETQTAINPKQIFIDDGQTYPLETIEVPKIKNGYINIVKII